MELFWSGFSSFIIGIGLSAACGFRIVIPFWGLSLAAMTGCIQLAPELQWIATKAAFWAFATAAVFEIGAYYIPWLDNILDAAATPLAVIAGVVITASVITDLSPFWKWTIALIAGGSIAGTIQTGSALLRGMSSISTGGGANALVATAELVGSLVTTAVSLLAPIVAFIIVLFFVVWIVFKLMRRRTRS